MAMPTARAIRFKSGLPPAPALRSASWRMLSLLLLPTLQQHTTCPDTVGIVQAAPSYAQDPSLPKCFIPFYGRVSLLRLP